ncbi:aminomethyl-transferring glycine dehydrogenase subunit GcvPB [Methylocaldum szegediense]|uniref:Probable glycine dehydrogenase (decarboxylating) subunit 2 n=1 Tax=Methylocaldum szegediense TaxID=73780 RepID=A0ABM9I409_9GAMM|nr:aminomethyl-transferring glycine dehydrogenase subunit GcvPB [Methylocaldum szegediense]CAI8877652.1 putative glycine dehydrogenase (decarboxylating) subunit 2 [Methylocaldum szegediense]
MLIFDRSRTGRAAHAQLPREAGESPVIPDHLLRKRRPALPEVSELDVVRHYTRLSQQNYSIDTQFYPLGSCTMKYNPKVCHELATLPEFLNTHPLALERAGQGTLACLYELQEMLREITGMAGVSLACAAGAQGELAGVLMIRAYHALRGDSARTEILVPDAAHGTNPASASMGGFQVREVATGPDGNVDLAALEQAVGPQTAGIMLTNPSTLGVFEQHVQAIADIVHKAGGLLYYDGANLNAIAGKVRPGDMGFDVIHLNLHKTFSTPHGGGGPGAGPVGVNDKLLPFLPLPIVAKDGSRYRMLTEAVRPHSIGHLVTFAGNVGVLLRAYVYIRMLGREGLERVAEFSTLNANYLLKKLVEAGFEPAFPQRLAAHEFIITLKRLAKERHVTALDFAKRLLDYGVHAPTVYFPLLIPECLLIEPTETESKDTLDRFAEVMAAILKEAETDTDRLKNAPHSLPVRRLDEVGAARRPDLAYTPE